MATRDAGARRRLADQVREVIESAPRSVAPGGLPIARTNELAAAASAVVLASDLQAPDDGRKEGVVTGLDGIVQAANRYGVNDQVGEAIAHAQLLQRRRVSPNRQGWRARLANVERLLVKCIENQDGDWMHGSYPPLEEALAEIRAMIDGDGE